MATKRKIHFTDYMRTIMDAILRGLLLTTKAGGKVNSMVIGGGTLGSCWNKPVFTVYVRTGRFTCEQLASNPEFSINVPTGASDQKIITICGGKSGRSTDKVKEAGLTLVDPEIISVPGIKEFPLTFECRVIYHQLLNLSALNIGVFYPQDIDSTTAETDRDPHITYVGEIVSSYVIEA